ncbi:MAG: tRNA (cytidine(34)-2'-O)-methyltransferase [Actinomycetota bacterium]|nr:tRNA (cytidine(34)-2'-O)-methyltransferase [Actinomycetota bacterium]MDA3013002.1 tRNA (cytidine(34)-2'-O)-methyltransferase [Actinomycetota bacterium]
METVIYQPEIAGNVGAIIRLSANTGIRVNFIKPFGFEFQENKIRRAGLDYHDLASVVIYDSWEEFIQINRSKNIACLSSKGADSYWDVNLNNFDFLIFGPESIGLPESVLSEFKTITIPMEDNSRSINLANAVSAVLFESLRQKFVK